MCLNVILFCICCQVIFLNSLMLNLPFCKVKSCGYLTEYLFLCKGFLYSMANVATKTAVKVKDTVKETVEGKV